MAGILACTMSTADSQLLAAASSVSQNLLQDFVGIKMKEKTAMLIARLTVLGIAVISILLAWNPNSSVFKIVSFAWAGFGAAFGPVVLFALFWKRSNKWGALARHTQRWNHGICMEVPGSSPWRRVGYL